LTANEQIRRFQFAFKNHVGWS